MSFDFSPSSLIRNSVDFERAFRHQSLTNKWFTLYFIDSKHQFARLGLVISKRNVPKAVHRNLAKRLIREFFRTNTANLPHLDFVVRIRRNLTRDKIAEASSALKQIMQSAKIV